MRNTIPRLVLSISALAHVLCTAGCFSLAEGFDAAVLDCANQPRLAVVNHTEQPLQVWLNVARPECEQAPSLDLTDGPWEVPAGSTLLLDDSWYDGMGPEGRFGFSALDNRLVGRFRVGLTAGSRKTPSWYGLAGGALEVHSAADDLAVRHITYSHAEERWGLARWHYEFVYAGPRDGWTNEPMSPAAPPESRLASSDVVAPVRLIRAGEKLVVPIAQPTLVCHADWPEWDITLQGRPTPKHAGPTPAGTSAATGARD